MEMLVLWRIVRETIASMSRNRWLPWALLGACGVLAFTAFAYPMYVIRPFRAQGADELAAALFVRRYGPIAAAIGAAVGILAAAIIWRRSSRAVPKIGSAALAVFTIAFAAISHINVYELMFHRIDTPKVMAANEAKLESDDMVLAIKLGGQARAYPIRMMGYHHIVNDRIGDDFVVGTY